MSYIVLYLSHEITIYAKRIRLTGKYCQENIIDCQIARHSLEAACSAFQNFRTPSVSLSFCCGGNKSPCPSSRGEGRFYCKTAANLGSGVTGDFRVTGDGDKRMGRICFAKYGKGGKAYTWQREERNLIWNAFIISVVCQAYGLAAFMNCLFPLMHFPRNTRVRKDLQEVN